MKKILVALLFISQFSLAQNPLVKQWDYRFGGTGDEYLSCFLQTSDLGYILGGHSWSDVSGDKTQPSWGESDFWIVKVNAIGSIEWNKRFGGTGYDELFSIQQTSDGGYILGGFSLSDSSGDKTQPNWGDYDYWIVKIDVLGNKQWDKRFGGSGDDELYSLQQTTDGGYILGGSSQSPISGDKSQAPWGSFDYWILKTDSLGNKQWDKRFGGGGLEYLYAIQQTFDGGFILGGYSTSDTSGDRTESSWGYSDYWIVKTDTIGNKEWDKRYGGTDWDQLYSLQPTPDNGYILGGCSQSGVGGDKTQPVWGPVSDVDYWIVKIDSVGALEWDKDFGGFAYEDFFGSISNTTDKGYLIAGWSKSDISGDKTEDNLGPLQSWVIKIDSLGNKIWDMTLFSTAADNGGYTLQGYDGCYVIATPTNSESGGYKTQANWDPSNNTGDYWIVKFCDTTFATSSSLLKSNRNISIYPNPSNGIFIVELLNGLMVGDILIDVVNTLGQNIFSSSEKIISAELKTEIDLGVVTDGIYFIEIKSKDAFLKKKIVITH